MFNRANLTRILLVVLLLLAGAASSHAAPARQAADHAPTVYINAQVILPGENFGDIVLADSAHDPDYATDQLTWTITGYVDLAVETTSGVVTITPPDAAWRGSETLRFEACNPDGACGAQEAVFWVMEESGAPVEITYIYNAGFLITIGDKKILIDALLDRGSGAYAPPQEQFDAVANGDPPFDGADLVLTTHEHFDHFSVEMVSRYLTNTPGTVFVAETGTANYLIDAGHDNVIPVDVNEGERRGLVVNGIGVECYFISHGGDIRNLGFLITAGGRRIFHPGDIVPDFVPVSYLQAYGLPDKHIDVALIPYVWLIDPDTHPIVLEGIQPAYVIAMHYGGTHPSILTGMIERNFPDAITFQAELETWTLP